MAEDLWWWQSMTNAFAVQVTADGGYIIAGDTRSFGAGNTDAWCLKLDASGNVIWQKTYGTAGPDSAKAVQVTADGGYFFAGHDHIRRGRLRNVVREARRFWFRGMAEDLWGCCQL